MLLGSCASLPNPLQNPAAQAESERRGSSPRPTPKGAGGGPGGPGEPDPDAPVAIQAAIAQRERVEGTAESIGTTTPVREVVLRSQAEGRVVELSVDVGDRVEVGQVVGSLDDRLQTLAINRAKADLVTRQAEVEQARAEVSDAQASVAQEQVELRQAQADAQRLSRLASQGAVPVQDAEQARSRAQGLGQSLRAAQEQVRTRQRAVEAKLGQVAAQQGAIAEEQERRRYAVLSAPSTGIVLSRTVEPGSLLQPGNEILRLGDFRQVKVVVQVSELELGRVRLGQKVPVRLDAFPQRRWSGRVSRIAPVADATARLVPVEVTVDNGDAQIKGGLLARVQFTPDRAEPVVIAAAALELGKGGQGGRAGRAGRAGRSEPSSPSPTPTNTATLYILPPSTAAPDSTPSPRLVQARAVTLGQRHNDRVEVLSGLQPGETYVIKSDRPLKPGQAVRLSILSDSSP